jgi:hypothetical protein
MMTTAMKTRLIRPLGAVAVLAALVVAVLAIQLGTGGNVAHAQASCAGTTHWIPSISNGSGTYDCIDGIGNQGDAVSQIQASLDHCYWENLNIDGVYGNLTAAAMKRAQKSLGVTQDGVYGPHTRTAGFLFYEGWSPYPNPHVICVPAGF